MEHQFSTAQMNNGFVGSLPGGKNPLDGGVDDLRIYKRALSAADISQLYNQR
jgi:hypothetical protein